MSLLWDARRRWVKKCCQISNIIDFPNSSIKCPQLIFANISAESSTRWTFAQNGLLSTVQPNVPKLDLSKQFHKRLKTIDLCKKLRKLFHKIDLCKHFFQMPHQIDLCSWFYVAFVLSLYLPQIIFRCRLRKAVLRGCSIFWAPQLILLAKKFVKLSHKMGRCKQFRPRSDHHENTPI